MGESIQGKLVSLPHPGSVWRPYLGGIPAYELDFSKDGEWVAYVRSPDHTLWKSKVDGSQPAQLTSLDVEAQQPHWSPEGTRIAFMGRQRSGARWRVMILTLGGQTEEPLPEGEDQGVPTWSPDGREVLYGDWPSGKDSPPMGLHLVDLFSHHTTLMKGSETLWTPRWSPDGAYIAALRQDSKSLLLTRTGESSWQEIMTGVALDHPVWSVDSKHIYLTCDGGQQLRRVNVLTGKVEQLAEIRNFPLAYEQWFGVAPDGSSLALQGVHEQEIYALRWVLP
jgi:Tol biopolymer transport system component